MAENYAGGAKCFLLGLGQKPHNPSIRTTKNITTKAKVDAGLSAADYQRTIDDRAHSVLS